MRCVQCGGEPRRGESVISLCLEARLFHFTCFEVASAEVIAHAHDLVDEATLLNESSRGLLDRAKLRLVESAEACARAREAVEDTRHRRGGNDTCISCDVGAFLAARNRHDIDGLMALMSDFCILDVSGSVPLLPGRYEGEDAVRGAYSALFEAFPDAQWAETSYAIGSSTSACEWTFRGKRADSAPLVSAGHDVLVFNEGRIAVQTSRQRHVHYRRRLPYEAVIDAEG